MNIRHDVISVRVAIVAALVLLAAIGFNLFKGSEPAQARGWSVAISECQFDACKSAHHGPGDTGQGSHEHSGCAQGSCGHAFMTAPETKANFSSFEKQSADRVYAELTEMSAPPPQPPPKHAIL